MDEVLHDCSFAGKNPTMPMNDNDVIRHELSELFDISGLNGRSQASGYLPDILNFCIRAASSIPERMQWTISMALIVTLRTGSPSPRHAYQLPKDGTEALGQNSEVRSSLDD